MLTELLLKSFFSAVLGLILGYVFAYLKEKVPAKYKWRLSNPEKAKFVIATSAEIDTGKYIRLTTGLGQVLAISKLLASFISAYSKKCEAHIQFSARFPESDLKNDLIIIGGTKNNKISDSILSKCQNLPYTQKVIDDVDVIFDKRRNQYIYGKLIDGKVREDFGLIISMPNPYNPDAKAILFLSVHTYGLEAAAEAFVNNIGLWKNLRNDKFICLVKCTINESIVSPPEILDFVKLENIVYENN